MREMREKNNIRVYRAITPLTYLLVGIILENQFPRPKVCLGVILKWFKLHVNFKIRNMFLINQNQFRY